MRSALLQHLRSVLAAWNGFWFTPADPTVLGLMRIFCGVTVCYAHLLYGLHLDDWFGKDAWVDRRAAEEFRHDTPWVPPPTRWGDVETAPLPQDARARDQWLAYYERWLADVRVGERGNWSWSLWYHVSDPSAMVWVHALFLGVMALFTVGYCTRVTAAITWLAALSYVHRTPEVTFGFDAVMCVALFYLTLGPSGAALSIDRWLERRREAARGEATGPPPFSVSANFTLRICQIHICLVYLSAGLSKLLGPAWWNGMAIWSILVNPETGPLRHEAYAAALRWLVDHRALQEVLQTGAAFFTVAVEIGFAFLIWNRRWRWVMIVGVVLLHLGIGILMDIAVFSAIMLTMVLSFVPAEAIHATGAWLRSRGWEWLPERMRLPSPCERPDLSLRGRA